MPLVVDDQGVPCALSPPSVPPPVRTMLGLVERTVEGAIALLHRPGSTAERLGHLVRNERTGLTDDSKTVVSTAARFA